MGTSADQQIGLGVNSNQFNTFKPKFRVGAIKPRHRIMVELSGFCIQNPDELVVAEEGQSIAARLEFPRQAEPNAILEFGRQPIDVDDRAEV